MKNKMRIKQIKSNSAQEYLDCVYGRNQQRDKSDNHDYYLTVISGLLSELNNQRRYLKRINK